MSACTANLLDQSLNFDAIDMQTSHSHPSPENGDEMAAAAMLDTNGERAS